MPRTTINEVDKSRFSPAYTAAPMTILVPGTASFGPVATSEYPEVTSFAGEEFITDFYSKFGTAPAQYSNNDGTVYKTITGDFSFEYATNLITSGANVVFMRLNRGIKATAPISGAEEAADTEPTIEAKYSGSFGNNIACKFEKFKYTVSKGSTPEERTDLYLSIYISSHPFTKANIINKDGKAKDVIKKWSPIFFTRVSHYLDSKYYVDSNTNLEYITLDADDVAAIIDSIGENETVRIINLGGGYDFATADVNRETNEENII